MRATSKSTTSLEQSPVQGSPPFVASDKHLVIRRVGFTAIAANVDLFAMATAAIAIRDLVPFDTSHASIRSHMADSVDPVVVFAFLLAVVFVAITFFRDQYGPAYFLSFSAQVGRTTTAFSLAFCIAAALGFPLGATAELVWSRAGALLIASFPAVLVGRFILSRGVKASPALAGIAPRRTILLGTEEEIADFNNRFPLDKGRFQVVTTVVLREQDTLADDLALTVAAARALRADDVFILVAWSETETLERCLDAFLCVPAFVHLGSGPMLDHLAQARIAKAGPMASLTLDRSSLYGPNILVKRAFDITLSFAALVVLAPLFLGLAIAIAVDSKGPVLFRQRRYGFNQEPFWIIKFRSMSTTEDLTDVKQATVDDPRVTRVGRFMRRTNLDELPQLLNVLIGNMSLVGPRPHALAHDRLFSPSITLYGRRHNVKPGITGWAQVNGLRGEVTPETLKARIAHDLYYIDNWSLRFDLWIIWRTITSRKAFLNAY